MVLAIWLACGGQLAAAFRQQDTCQGDIRSLVVRTSAVGDLRVRRYKPEVCFRGRKVLELKHDGHSPWLGNPVADAQDCTSASWGFSPLEVA